MSRLRADVDYQHTHINENLSAGIIVACILCLFAAYAAVALRFYSRKLNQPALKKVDWTIVLSLVGQGALITRHRPRLAIETNC